MILNNSYKKEGEIMNLKEWRKNEI